MQKEVLHGLILATVRGSTQKDPQSNKMASTHFNMLIRLLGQFSTGCSSLFPTVLVFSRQWVTEDGGDGGKAAEFCLVHIFSKMKNKTETALRNTSNLKSKIMFGRQSESWVAERPPSHGLIDSDSPWASSGLPNAHLTQSSQPLMYAWVHNPDEPVDFLLDQRDIQIRITVNHAAECKCFHCGCSSGGQRKFRVY